MRRPVLLTVIALGAAITLAGAGGTIAAFTDEAKTGTNSIETGALPSPVNLQIGTWDRTAGSCDGLSDDLTTGLYSVSDLQPSGNATSGQSFCIKNAGNTAASLAARATDYTSVDIACTNDEPARDTTCGDNGAGELGDVGNLNISGWSSCASDATFTGPSANHTVATWTGGSVLGTINGGETRCFTTSFGYNPGVDDAVAAQSDKVTWRFTFTSTAS
jgi:predicted ribosomally synthesized peptide with SipW-like signal peptide